MKKTIIISKETNYQKWLDDYNVHLESKDVIIGKQYDGCVTNDGEKLSSKCRTIYYDSSRKILLAEDIAGKKFLVMRGRMYAHKGVIYAEECNVIKYSKSLYLFVEESIAKSNYDRSSLNKETLFNALLVRFHPKVRGLYMGSLEIIADAYLGGWIE